MVAKNAISHVAKLAEESGNALAPALRDEHARLRRTRLAGMAGPDGQRALDWPLYSGGQRISEVQLRALATQFQHESFQRRGRLGRDTAPDRG